MSRRALILGAGGHAKVVCDILALTGWDVVGYLDDDAELSDTTVLGRPVLGTLDELTGVATDGAIVGIGDNDVRRSLYERLRELGIPIINAIHPSAQIASSAAIGLGITVAAHVTVNPEARICDNVILNTASSVDHDTVVEAHAHIAPGARLCGDVRVGTGALVGVGVSIVPRVSVGAGAVIAAGAVVTRDIPDYVMAAGAPARVIRRLVRSE